LLLCARPVFGQTTPEPDAEATMRFGPLALKSTIALSNIGVDTNVFNEADVANPQSDFTMTFTPTTDLWVRLGRTWISGRVNVDWVYYRRFASERSANTTYAIGVDRTFNRLSLNGGVRRLSTRERPGFEIDVRSQRLEVEWDGGADLRVFPKTSIGAKTSRRRIEFDRFAVFQDANLAQELNRTTTTRGFVVKHVLTPLTTVSMDIGTEQERFLFSTTRDADSTRIVGTVSFQPLALITGSAAVGYRGFNPLSADIPPYRGTTAAVGLSYSLLGTTRIGVDVGRDVQPSFEIEQPYYLESGASVWVQQQVYGPFDILGRVTNRRLAYRERRGVPIEFAGRTDTVGGWSLGAGYRIGTDKRMGFTVERQRRTSSLDGHAYDGLRFGASLTYER
jgi:hypothetical protein